VLRALLIFVLYSLSQFTHACMIPAQGYQWTGVDLAAHSRRIILVTVDQKKIDGMFATYKVHIDEVIREKDKINRQEFIFQYFSDKHSDQTFNNHTDNVFWHENIGRTECERGCFCGVNHVFKKGATYLIFLDELGALKSAEMIKDKRQDKWLQYVREAKYSDKQEPTE